MLDKIFKAGVGQIEFGFAGIHRTDRQHIEQAVGAIAFHHHYRRQCPAKRIQLRAASEYAANKGLEDAHAKPGIVEGDPFIECAAEKRQ